MASKTEIAAAVAFVFTSYNREPNEMHLEAWYMMLGQYPQSEVAAAVRRVVEASETLPPVGAVVRAIRDARVTANRNMTSTVQDSMRIAGLVKEFRRANPEATADEVSEYVSRLERRLSVR
jgi:hypothetical protein